jgi:hypothetical protein
MPATACASERQTTKLISPFPENKKLIQTVTFENHRTPRPDDSGKKQKQLSVARTVRG